MTAAILVYHEGVCLRENVYSLSYSYSFLENRLPANYSMLNSSKCILAWLTAFFDLGLHKDSETKNVSFKQLLVLDGHGSGTQRWWHVFGRMQRFS